MFRILKQDGRYLLDPETCDAAFTHPINYSTVLDALALRLPSG
jgi:hypothetical protein